MSASVCYLCGAKTTELALHSGVRVCDHCKIREDLNVSVSEKAYVAGCDFQSGEVWLADALARFEPSKADLSLLSAWMNILGILDVSPDLRPPVDDSAVKAAVEKMGEVLIRPSVNADNPQRIDVEFPMSPVGDMHLLCCSRCLAPVEIDKPCAHCPSDSATR